MLIHRSILSAILLIGLLPTNPVLAEQKTTSKASYGYAITVNEKNEFYIELGHSTINKAIDLSKKRCLSTNKGNCFLLSSGNKRFVAFSMQIINDKFVTFLAQKKAGLGATSSNESIKDAIRGSKYACISNAPAKKSNCHINLLFDQLKQQQWSFVGKNSEAIPTSKSSNYSQAK